MKSDLDSNLLQGEIPTTLKNLVQLEYLNLGFNNLTGYIPDALKDLSLLQFLDLSDNRLSGPLPESLGNLTKLSFLDVRANFLTGGIPRTFDQLASIRVFGVDGNSMSGKIPTFISNWTKLQHLWLRGNNFEGPLPNEIFMMGNLLSIFVSDLNRRNGSFHPFPFVNFTSMEFLTLKNCSISGEIPPDIGKISSLSYLDLSFNNLSGIIPSSLNKLPLDYIVLNNNNLQGEIPKGKSTFRGDFSFNKFTQERVIELKDEYMNYFNCCAIENISNRVFPQDLTTTLFCNKSRQNTSLHINCGGNQQIQTNGATYEKDNDKSRFHVSNNWAYSCSGPSDVDPTKNLSCGVGFSDTVLFATARACPSSLKYYGCLRNGKFDVTLHFAEIEYNNKEDYSILHKRIFDIYIQGERKVKDFNIVQEAGGPDMNFNRSFPAIDVRDHILEIHLYWAGKGTYYDNGVLISGIAVTPIRKSGVGPLEIAMIAVACVVFLGLLVLAFAWHLGWIGNKSMYEKRIDI